MTTASVDDATSPADDGRSGADLGAPVLRRTLLRGAAAAAAAAAGAAPAAAVLPARRQRGGPTLIGSANALRGMERFYADLVGGGEPLDVAIEVVKIVEKDPRDRSVGLGGLPDESGEVTLDAAVMHGPTHNSGAVACLRNILHPSEVARLVMERTDHCLIVDRGAYDFARSHGHEHVDLLTDEAREIWMRWKESMSERDDRLPPRPDDDDKNGMVIDLDGEKVAVEELFGRRRITGTIHCSALGKTGDIACTTTTSGLAWKIPGRVGDSPIVGAGLYCDQEAGSAGGTGRGESAVLANASFAAVELMRGGAAPVDALREVLQRVQRQAKRASAWQPALVREDGRPSFDLQLYAVDLQGRTAGMSLRGRGSYAVADPEKGPRHEPLMGVD
ncbi:MAG: isoaspartyl peptidase/L-asparaginase [Planctomycetota bacterium]